MAPPGGSQGDLAGLPPLREAEACESTGHKNAQPTRPERNAQAADLHRPSKDDPQQMHYRHDEKQRGGDRHIRFFGSIGLSSRLTSDNPASSLGSSRVISTRWVRWAMLWSPID